MRTFILIWLCIFGVVLITSSGFAMDDTREPLIQQMSLKELLMPSNRKPVAPPRPHTESPVEVWTGRWFPGPPSNTKSNSETDHVQHGGIPMGIVNPGCDDAKTNLSVDWDFSPVNYTCFSPVRRITPDFDVQPRLELERIPQYYSAVHYCMNETISYDVQVPTFGPHRPLWPRYGEYRFLPVQRWLHSLEHGGVVMLYHPCAHPLEVNILRQVVKSCLYRHVITPSRQLSTKRPLAVLTWGKRLIMSTVNVRIVKDFISQNALSGPEKVSRDGQYDRELLNPAKIVSDSDDSELCPENFRDLSH